MDQDFTPLQWRLKLPMPCLSIMLTGNECVVMFCLVIANASKFQSHWSSTVWQVSYENCEILVIAVTSVLFLGVTVI